MSSAEAEEGADMKLRQDDMIAFIERYGIIISYIIKLSAGYIHTQIMNTIQILRERDMSEERAILLSLRKYSHYIDEYLDNEEENRDVDDRDENETSDSKTESENSENNTESENSETILKVKTIQMGRWIQTNQFCLNASNEYNTYAMLFMVLIFIILRLSHVSNVKCVHDANKMLKY